MPGRSVDRLLKLLFGLGLVGIGFLLGIACVFFRFFPYGLLVDARSAAEAWALALTSAPSSFLGFESEPAPPPAMPAGGNAEPILIGGGFSENLAVCPAHGCLAWIVARDGTVLHRWEVDPAPVIASLEGYAGITTARNLKAKGWYLLDDGDLLAVFESLGTYPYGGSIARYGWDGELRWVTNNRAHHWPNLAEDGLIYVPRVEPAPTPYQIGTTALDYRCHRGGIEIDHISVVDGDGAMVEDIDVFARLLEAGYAGLLSASSDDCDPLHMNFIEPVSAAAAARDPLLEPGDLLVSLRNLNALVLLGAGDRHVKWLLSGVTGQQHSPQLGVAGDILMFDNFGGQIATGGSRIVRTRPGLDRVESLFPPDGAVLAAPFFTGVGGHLERHPTDPRVLVALTKSGQVVEVDLAAGEIVWAYAKQFPSGGYPGADGDMPLVRTEAYGGYYVTSPDVLARLAAAAPSG